MSDLLHIVITRYGEQIVHTRSFVALQNAESYFQWKSNNLNPNDPKWPADSCALAIAQLTPVKEKGAVAAAPRTTLPSAAATQRRHTPYGGGYSDDDTFSGRR
jgi:hypothetical protein